MFNRQSAATFAVGIALAISPARAQEPDAGLLAMNNFHHEIAECVAYYTAIAKCATTNPKFGHFSEAYNKAAQEVLGYYWKVGEVLEITNDAAQSRLVLSAQDMVELINSNCINISSLLARYSDKCVAISIDPAKELKARLASAK
jgi:hypothetical protein